MGFVNILYGVNGLLMMLNVYVVGFLLLLSSVVVLSSRKLIRVSRIILLCAVLCECMILLLFVSVFEIVRMLSEVLLSVLNVLRVLILFVLLCFSVIV